MRVAATASKTASRFARRSKRTKWLQGLAPISLLHCPYRRSSLQASDSWANSISKQVLSYDVHPAEGQRPGEKQARMIERGETVGNDYECR